MRWNLRLKAAERGIWKSAEMRRRLAEAGLEFSAGKMSALWSGTPTSVRLDDLDVICAILDCDPAELLIPEPDKVAARRPQNDQGGEQRRGVTDGETPVRESQARTACVTRPPARCNRCQVNRVAWARPRVDYCYECLPGGPFPPPACRDAARADTSARGSATAAIQAGRRIWAPVEAASPGVCTGLTASAVGAAGGGTRTTPSATANTAVATPPSATRTPAGCASSRPGCSKNPDGPPNMVTANQYGQQLFLANMRFQRLRTPRLKPEPKRSRRAQARFRPLEWRQLALFEMDLDPQIVVARALVADNDLIRYCKDIVAEHSQRYGWSKRQRNDVVRSLRLLQVLQDTPGAQINATDVLQLPRYSGNITSTLEVLAAAELLNDDRPSHVERYFATKTGRVPEPMKTQLNTWLEVMLNGSSQAPGNVPETPRPPASTSWALPPSCKPGPTPGTGPWPRSPPNRSAPRCRPAGPGGTGPNTGCGPCSRSSRPAS